MPPHRSHALDAHLKICFASDSYPTLPKAGGVSFYTQTAARALAARGHEVHVLIGIRGQSSDQRDGVVQIHLRPIRWLPVVSRWFPGLGESVCLAWWLRALRRRYNLDIAEIPNWEGMGLVASALGILPVVVRLYTSTGESLRIKGSVPTFGDRFLLWAEKASPRLARSVVTHSHAHAHSTGCMYGLDNIHVIPLGIALPKSPSESSNRSLAVLSVGFLTPRKGVDILLAAVPLVLAEEPEAEFWIAGADHDHRYETEFRKTHPEIPHNKVRFLGYVSNDELNNLYDTCAVYASASVYESFGLTFVEAMAHGKPVVGCAVSAMLEVIDDGVTGLLVPPNDPRSFANAIVTFLQNRSLRERCGAAGRRVALDRYSAELMAERMEQYFAGIAGSVDHTAPQ
jgi:glycogen synthase